MLSLHLLLLALFLPLVLSAPAAQSAAADSGITFEKRADSSLPLLKLPYGTWRAAKYDSGADIYTFKNIRFAAPPVGNLRWAKPAPPLTETTIQDGSIGQQCIQSKSVKAINFLGPGAENPVGANINEFIGGLPFPASGAESEDCLFLDVYVPGKAVRNPSSSKLPVVVWIYGGAYAFGSKEYDGSGLIEQSGGNIIFVAGNYRLGTYGFLAGTTMEKEGLPNAGLWDQRAVFQWVQNYISLVGGDKTQVSAWGESAGAGSIFHHLVAQGGTMDPMFSKVVTQSAAFQPLWDRRGSLEHVFQNFTALAGCAGQGVACLRAASAATLQTANRILNQAAPDGSFIVGPSPDGSFVRQLAPLEFASGNYWKGIQSLIISHTKDEANLFVDGHIQTDSQFQQFLQSVFPNYVTSSGLTQSILNFYPSPSASGSPYDTQTDRVKEFVRDSSFTCYSRYLTNAFAGKTYNLQYSVTPGYHATDLLPTFYSANFNFNIFGHSISLPLIPGFGTFAQAYQSYLTSHARTGDPNTYKKTWNLPPAITWPHPDASGEDMGKVLNAGNLGFSVITDKQLPKSHCDFWMQLAAAATNLGGYAVPGTAQAQSLVPSNGNPSANFPTP